MRIYTNTKYDILGWMKGRELRGWIIKTAYPQVYKKYEFVKIPLYHLYGDLYPQWYPKKKEDRCVWWLRVLAGLVKDQDNYSTAHPQYIIQQRRRIYGMEQEYADHVAWRYDGEEVTTTQDENCDEVLEEFCKEAEISRDDVEEQGYIDIYEFVQPFFSERAALKFMENNKHRLTDPRLFIDSAHRNYEWQMIEEILEWVG